MPGKPMQRWEVWYPKAAATGLLFAAGRLDETERLLVHAPPQVLTVEVFDDDGRRIAFAQDLEQTLDSPMCLLTREGDTVKREDLWPQERDAGTPVLLPGGEVGIMTGWWNADDHMEWRWQVEFYNSRR